MLWINRTRHKADLAVVLSFEFINRLEGIFCMSFKNLQFYDSIMSLKNSMFKDIEKPQT